MTPFKKPLLLCGLAVALLFTAVLPAGAQVTKADDIVYPAMPSVEMPQPEKITLDNGLTLMLLEDDELPLVEVRALIRTGARWEPADKVGLAGLTGQLLRSGGTTNKGSDELDDWLEDRAAIIETGIGNESGTAFMSCLSEDLEEVFGQFAEILRSPAFDADKLEVAKTQVVAGIARQNDTPDQIRQREFMKLMYGADSPYARTSTYATIDAIERQDLVDWHGKWYHPDRIILGMVGDIDRDSAVALVKKTLGNWSKGPAVNEPSITIDKPKPGVYHAAKDGVTQATIRLGHLGIQRDNPDYYAVELMNQVLSGSFAARLFTRVRSQQGLAYSVRGGVQSGWDHLGVFQMSIGTKVETTVAGTEALLREARNMLSEPPTEDEVESARTGLLNSFVFRADSSGSILRQQMTYAYYGYPLDWLELYRTGIEEVTTDQVRAAAAKYIQPDEVAILIVGPSEGTDKPLDSLGTVQAVDISIPEPETETVTVTSEGKAKGRELIDRALQGIGGAEAVAKVSSMRVVSTMDVESPQGSMQLKSDSLVALPGRLRLELTLPFGAMTQILGPDGAFAQSPRGTQPLPDSQREQMEAGMVRLPVAMLQLRDSEGFEALSVGSEEFQGQTLEKVQVEANGHVNTFGLDNDGKIITIDYRGSSFTGAPGDIRQVYSDFRDIDGLMLPFASETTFNGEVMMTGTNESVELNVDVDDSLFQQPEG